ncbi:MAG TPA: hypothetical protein VHB25_21530 [Gemmatimonadaceae bacterium]|nr:hypothetical protein [Gemmatimonadaceae bacterium]
MRDSVTNTAVAAGTTLIARRHPDPTAPTAKVDTIQLTQNPYAFGGVGIWDLTLLHAGYAPWTRTSVTVKSTGRCDFPQPVAITARLVPAP